MNDPLIAREQGRQEAALRVIDRMARECEARHGEHPPHSTFKDDEWRLYQPDWNRRQLSLESELSR